MTVTRNEDLLRAIAERIRQQPETYSQRQYARKTACGTAYCIAGHALILTGKQPLFEAAVEGDYHVAYYFFSDHERAHASELGAQALGLDKQEAGTLFDEDWIPADGLTVPEALEKIAAGASIDDVSSLYDYAEEWS